LTQRQTDGTRSAARHPDPDRASRDGPPSVDRHLRVAVIVGVIGARVAIIYVLDVGWYYGRRP
jgi:hypothetical protein